MKNFKFWLTLCIINFFIVSVLGVMMRYNMAFSLPGFTHKFLQESHSHFAFYGWVSATIYLFGADYLSKTAEKVNTTKYQILMIANHIGSYGMLITFMFGGYYWLSIVFSSAALFACFVYFIFLLIDTKKNKNPEVIWLRSGAFFATISSIGIFGLAYFSLDKDTYEVLFRASTYFYLHYQYNGFFLFSCIGLLIISLKKYDLQIDEKENRTIFYLLFIGCFFGYGLSILWIESNIILYGFFALISLIQLIGAFKFWILIKNTGIFMHQNLTQKWLFLVFGSAFLIKFLLQTLSVIPALGAYAFNNINIVIAYLHLVLLMGISLFLIWKILELNYLKISKNVLISISFLIFGIVLNEIILATVGLFSVFYIPFLSAKYGLLFASVVIMFSIGGIISSLKLKQFPDQEFNQ